MKKYSLILLLLLNGCFYQSIDSNEIEVAKIICERNNSTTVKIKSFFDATTRVDCSNRKQFNLDTYSGGK